MKIIKTTTLIASILATASATAIGDPSALSASGNTFDLNARAMKKMDGVCTSKGGCKVPGGLHSAYSCWNSQCLPEDKGQPCVIAPGIDGAWVAKCPKNDLPYDWVWPWVPPAKNGKDTSD